MNKLIKKLAYILSFAMAFLASACSDDIDPEITGLDTNRVFSPTGVTAKIVDQTGVRLTWNSNSQADSYQIEILQGGATVKTVDDITNADIPYTITGLEGETEYTVQIKAIKAGVTDSKYSTITFNTDPEQIFKAIVTDELKATEVTLRWIAGESATEIVLTPGDIRHTVTAEEIAAGAATISGLTGETDYTAKLIKGTKTRGTAKFTTLVDLGGATPVYPGDDLAAAIAATDNGGTVVLLPAKDGSNEFSYTDEADAAITLELTLTKDISIKGMYATNRPTTHIKFMLDGCNNLKLENIDFDGTGNLITTLNSKGGEIQVTNCTATKYDTFLTETGDTKAGTINKFTVDNCIFFNLSSGKRFVDYQKKLSVIAEFTMINSTVYNSCKDSDFIRFDKPGATINLTNCTLHGVEATSKGLLYIRSSSAGKKEFTANISKCIFATMGIKVFFSQDAKTDNLLFSSNYYFNAPSLLVNPDGGSGKAFDSKGITADPGFKDAAKGDFTVSNETLKDNNIGDPRWLK